MGREQGRGWWCWCCDRHLPNERFGGKGRGRHMCKECARLPAEERAFRQAMLDIRRILDKPGKFRRKRPHLERFRTHPDPRVRAFVEPRLRVQVRAPGPKRLHPRAFVEVDDDWDDLLAEYLADEERRLQPWSDDDDIPF